MIEGKVWGKIQHVLSTGFFEIKRLKIKNGGFCSKHKHSFKFNGFFIESGELEITTWKDGLKQIVVLSSGDFLEIEPCVSHKFFALSEVVCYEMYWTQLINNDIERFDEGGVI